MARDADLPNQGSHFFLTRYHRYGDALNTHDLIKCIAIVLMIADHIGHFFLNDDTWWRLPGRVSAPIFLFLVGYSTGSRLRKDVMLLAFLMIVADILMQDPILPLNILVSILACQLFMRVIAKTDPDLIGFMLIAITLLILFPSVIFFEYGSAGFAFAVAGYYCRRFPERKIAAAALLFAVIFYILMMSHGFKFSASQNYLLMVEMIALGVALRRFSIAPIAVPDKYKAFAEIAKFLGRNSLYIYFIHFVLFQAIHFALKPATPFSITLMDVH